MALPGYDCSDDPIVCCTHLFDIGEQLKDLAVAAINNPDCFDSDCANPHVEGIVTVGRPYGYAPDLVIVWLERVGPSPLSTDQRGNTRPTVMWRSVWNIQVIESGWETFDPDGDDIILSDPGVINALAKASYSHAEQMYRRVANAVSRGLVGGCGQSNCWKQLGDLTPIAPEGLNVGWTMQVGVSADFDRHCEAS